MERNMKPRVLPTKTLQVRTPTLCGILCYRDSGCQAAVVRTTGHGVIDCSFYTDIENEYEADLGSDYGQFFFRIKT